MKQVLLLTLGCLLLWTTAAVALDHRESSHGVGKKGEITLTEPTKVGDRVLQPDTYVVQHRLLGGEHFLRFVELKKAQHWSKEWNVIYTEPDPMLKSNAGWNPQPPQSRKRRCTWFAKTDWTASPKSPSRVKM